jgi:Tfp pilus assembly protein PilO
MNKLSKEKRDRLVLIILVTGGIVATLYFLVISAQQRTLREYSENTDSAQAKLAKAEHWLRMSPNIQSQLLAARKDLESKEDGMAPVDKFKWFYDLLESSIARHRVKLTDITREPEISDVGVFPKFPYQAATFGVKLNARYDDFGSFLADFENEFPFMRVKNIDLTTEGTAKLDSRDTASSDLSVRPPETLAITMRVVTLIKPSAPL